MAKGSIREHDADVAIFGGAALRGLAAGLLGLAPLVALPASSAHAQDVRAATCITDTTPTGTGVRVFPAEGCGGLSFTVSIPNECIRARGRCGLILDIHGFAMDAEIENRNTQLRELGRQNGFVVAQPTARVVDGTPTFDLGGRDTDLIRSFAEQAVEAFGLNRRRVHVGGFSQGGVMAFDFVCRHADLIASAAPIAGAPLQNCFTMGPPVPVLQTSGVNDRVVPFRSAMAARDSILSGMGLQLSDGRVTDSVTGLERTHFENDRGQVYEFIQHEFTGAAPGDGHCIPGSFETDLTGAGPGQAERAFGCDDADEFRISQAQIRFYLDHEKQR